MGHGLFDKSASAARAAYRTSTGTSAFTYDTDIKTGKASKVCHEDMNLNNKNHRECRDNDDNPETVPIAIMVDVTGSMGRIAELIINDLNKVMSTIQDRGVVDHPSLLFGAIGDATCDRAPLQMGEFESDDELAESWLSKFYREGGGGGQYCESYEIPLWFFANHVRTDHWEKRGQKGYLFVIGDENYYSTISRDQVLKLTGWDIEGDIPVKAVVDQLQERWNVFCIRPGGSSHYNSDSIQQSWIDLLGPERTMKVEDWHEIVSLIAGTISVIEGLSAADAIAAMADNGMKVSSDTEKALKSLAIIDNPITPAANLHDISTPVERL